MDELLTMAIHRKSMDIRLINLEPPINEHLVKLLGFDFPPTAQAHFRGELRDWLEHIAALRLKPKQKTASQKFYYERLFDGPFGGLEAENTRALMQRIARKYPDAQAVRSPAEVAGLLQAYHRRLAAALHAGGPPPEVNE